MSFSDLGASPRKREPAFMISATAFSWYGTAAITKSGRAAMIWAALAVQESARIERPLLAASGQTSAQYLVQATKRSSLPTSARITVALGCRLTTRRGV